MDNIFYVYEWIRLDTNEPFYVGKGKGNRCMALERNRYFNNVVNKVGIEQIAVSILHSNLDEETSFEYETYYIELYKNYFGFSLTNMTAGGEGISGYRFTDEQRKKISAAGMGRRLTEEHKRKLREQKIGIERKEYVREKISKTLLNHKRTMESREKQKLTIKLRYNGKNPNMSRAGEINGMYGKKGELAPCYGRTGNLHPMYGKSNNGAKEANSKAIVVYKKETYYNEYSSIGEFVKELLEEDSNKSTMGSLQAQIGKLCKGWKPKSGRWVGWQIFLKE